MPAVELLNADDKFAGLRLSSEAGWNQTADDWSYMLANGQGFGVRADGTLVATSLALPYPPDFGWISMVLVSETYRRQGLATLLLGAAVEFLLARNLVPMLDATPDGRAVYSRLGFHQTELINRWSRGSAAAQEADPVSSDGHPGLDLVAFGADRSRLLNDIRSRPGSRLLRTDAGYALRRAGRSFSQIGPVVAATTTGGDDLLGTLIDQSDMPLVVDVPDRLSSIAEQLSAKGFSVQRQLFRMARSQERGFGTRSLIYASAGPEYG